MMARKKSSAKSRRQAGKPEAAGELVPVDTEKVDAAVRYINERTIQSGIVVPRPPNRRHGRERCR